MNSIYTQLSNYGIEISDDSGLEISRTKDLLYTHTGIVMGNNIYTGSKMIFHNHPKSGPAIVSIEEFSNGFQCSYTDRPMDSLDIVLKRSFQQVENGNEYKIVGYNCHNASTYARTGQSRSHGVNNTLGVLALIALFGIWSEAE